MLMIPNIGEAGGGVVVLKSLKIKLNGIQIELL
jgi:hypothetical protein